MRRVSSLAALAFALSLSPESASAASPVVPLVAPASAGGVELVKKKKSADDDEGDSGEKGAFDYIKMAITFDQSDVVEEVVDGRIIEHLLGGMFAGFGGHIWAPSIAYKDVDAPPVATTIGIIGTITAWAFVPGLLLCAIPVIGWYFGWLIFFIPSLIFTEVMNFWVIPRALQFAYSDAYASGGSTPKKKSKSKKKKKSDDDDDE